MINAKRVKLLDRKHTYEKCTLPQTRLLPNEETGVQGDGRLLFWEDDSGE